jgi:Mg/Co/Ni transporter MgtE
MNTEYVALRGSATVADAIESLRQNEELLETLNAIFLIDADERLVGTVPIGKLFIAPGGEPLNQLANEMLITVPVYESEDRVTELFDKYNVLTLPVVDEERRLSGIITADDIISVLREK